MDTINVVSRQVEVHAGVQTQLAQPVIAASHHLRPCMQLLPQDLSAITVEQLLLLSAEVVAQTIEVSRC